MLKVSFTKVTPKIKLQLQRQTNRETGGGFKPDCVAKVVKLVKLARLSILWFL